MIKIMEVAFPLFHLYAIPSNLYTSPMETYLPVAAALHTSLHWSFWDIVSRSASDWLVSGTVTAGSSIFTILLLFLLRVWLTVWASSTHWGSSASSCLFSFWPALLTNLLLPVPKIKSGTKGSNRFSLFSRRKFSPQKKKKNYFAIFKVTPSTVWAVGIPLALFGYFVPYVHLLSMLFVCW